jgi:hypothetical protein
MAYGLRYQTQAFAKSGKMFTAYIYEKDYVGAVDYIAAGYRPFEQNVLASSDDPFEPVLSSELTTILDITDFTGTIPDLTTRDDKKYHIKLKAGAAPEYNQSIILWKNYESNSTEFLDCNFQIYVNGQSELFEAFNNSGELQVNATDTVRFELFVFFKPAVLPIVGAGWRMIVKEDGITVFDETTQDPTAISAINYTFVAGYQKVYTVIAYSYQIGDDSQTIPVNTIYDIFQGYLLTDSATLQFNTGRNFLTLPFSDGMGMLKSIPYEQNYAVDAVTTQNGAVMVDINTTQTLLEVILQCLNKLELPDGFGLNIAVNLYATDMDESKDVFSQILYYRRNWQNSNLTWQDCHTILTTICRSFGAKIFQSNNEYWIVNTTDAASGTLRRFKYDQDGTLISLTVDDASRTVVPYTSSADHYFVNSNQQKIIRKGYPVIELNNTYTYAPTLIDNGNLRRPPVSIYDIAYNWAFTKTGSLSSITTQEVNGVYYMVPIAGNLGSVEITPNSVGNVFEGDKIEISFDYLDTVSTATTNPILQMRCELYTVSGSQSYQLNQNRDWQTFTPIPANYIWVNIESGGTYLSGNQTATISLPVIPFSSQLFLRFRVKEPDTQLVASVGNFRITGSSNLLSKSARGYFDFLSQYKRSQEMTLGVQVDIFSQLGAMLRENLDNPLLPTVWTLWHRYGSTDLFNNLPRLILQDYINIQSAAQINMQGSIMSIFSDNGPISIVNTFYFQDTTTTLTVGGLPYIVGNMRINFTDDEWTGTWLQVSDTEISETITDIITRKIYNLA